MSPEPMLERSVLERKERDELHAIADAMGLKPGTRTKKSDLVDSILRAAGIEVAPAAAEGEDKPKRTRARKAAAAVEAPPVEEGDAAPSADDATDVAAARTNGHAVDGAEEAPAHLSVDPDTVVADAGTRQDDAGAADRPSLEADEASEAVAAALAAHTAEADEIDDPTALAARAVEAQPTHQGRQQGRGGQPQAQPGNQLHGQPGQGQGGAQPGNQAQNGQRQGEGGQGEPGNSRRSRRRRGRDRDRTQGGELQQGQDGAFSGEPVDVEGFLDLTEDGWGFLRTKGWLPSANDVYVSISQVRRFALRRGDFVKGASRPPNPSEKFAALLRIDTISGLTPEEAAQRPKFEELTPLFPDEKLKMEVPGEPATLTCRIVDLIAPLGKGQRGLIVSPPKAGKTTVMKQIATAIEKNNPEVHLMVLLVDERPEEVTDMRRSIDGEVVASTFDRPSSEHTMVAELAVERAKRLVEMGRDVVIILDGITRLSRAYNLSAPASGRLLSGGIDSAALYPPKKFFGAARNVEEGGSLTILATALVDTGSKMDEVIFEEFKGTGNMELRLDRRIAERRVYPAIDVNASSTRHEELLFDKQQLEMVWRLRRALNGLVDDGGSPAKSLEMLLDGLKKTRNNDEFLALASKSQSGHA